MTIAGATPQGPHGRSRRARGLPFWRRLSWRLGSSLLLLIALGIVLSGWLQYRAQDRFLRQSLGGLLLNIARTGAFLVDGDLHAAAVREGHTSGAYTAVRRALRRIQETNQLSDPVYTLTDIEGDMARIGVTGAGEAPARSGYRLAPGTRDPLRRARDEGIASFTDLYLGERGAWITAFAPIKTATGRTVAVLGVDFRADVYLARLAAIRRQLYLHALVAAALALVAGILLARRITGPLRQLTDQARRVVEGDFVTRVHVGGGSELARLGRALHIMIDRLRISHRSLVGALVRALEAHGGEHGALDRLAAAATAVGDRLQLNTVQREALELGARLHDIGELQTPESLLTPGPLSPEARRELRRHPAAGVEILEAVPLLTPALDVVGTHHERWDGAGYPQGLRGEEIPLVSRIVAVVDALDAMTHDRPYRRALSVRDALEEVRAQAGRQFDPRVVQAVLSIGEEQWAALLAPSLDRSADGFAPIPELQAPEAHSAA